MWGRVLGTVSWVAIDYGMLGVGALLFNIIVGRTLSPTDFGAFALIMAIVGMLSPISQWGAPPILLARLPRRRRDRSVLVTYAYLTSIALFVAFYVTIVVGALVISGGEIAIAAALLSVRLVIGPNQVFIASYQARQQVRTYATRRLVTVSIGLLLGIAVAATHPSLIAFSSAVAVESVLFATSILWASRRTLHVKFGRVRWTMVRQLTLKGLPLVVQSVAAVMYLRADQILVGAFCGPSEVGIYAAAVRVTDAMSMVPQAISIAAVPILSRRIIRSPVDSERDVILLSRLMLLYGLCGVGVLFLFGRSIVIFLFGPPYAEGASIVAVYGISTLFFSIGLLRNQILIILREQRTVMWTSIVGALSNVAFNVILIPLMGPIGAAWATVVSYCLCYVVATPFGPFGIQLLAYQIGALFPLGDRKKAADAGLGPR